MISKVKPIVVTHYYRLSKGGIHQEAFNNLNSSNYSWMTVEMQKRWSEPEIAQPVALRPQDAQDLCDRWNRSCSDFYYSLTPPMMEYYKAKEMINRVDKICGNVRR